MTKTLKKTLAIVVALALCLSAFMGCFSVSAEGNTVTVTGDEITVGDTTAEVEIDIAVPTGFAAAILEVDFTGLKIAGRTVIDDETGEPAQDPTNPGQLMPKEPDITIKGEPVSDYSAIAISHNSCSGNNYDVAVANQNGKIRIIVDAPSVNKLHYFTKATITIKFDTTAIDVAGTHTVKVANVQAASGGAFDMTSGTYTGEEALIKFADATGDVVVNAAHVHAPAEGVYEKNADQHWQVCAEHPDVIVGDKAVHSYENGVCVCGATEPVVEPECEHDWEVVTATPATETTDGSVTLDCTKCDEADGTVETVHWHYEYRPRKFNLNMAARTELNYYVYDANISDRGNPQDAFFKTSIAMDGDPVVDYTTWAEAEDVKFEGVDSQRIATGIKSKFMTNPVTINAFVKDNGVWYSGNPVSLSVVDAATRLYANITESERKLYADLLDYGGKAQIYFEYRLDNLANSDANLGNYKSYVTTTNPTVEDNKINDKNLPSVRTARFNMDLADTVAVVFTLRLDEANPIPDISNVSASVSYTKLDGSVSTTNYTEFEPTADASRYIFRFSEFNSRQWERNFTVKYQVSGVEEPSELTCSIEDLVAYLITTGISDEEIDMYYAMLKYGKSSQAHFGS